MKNEENPKHGKTKNFTLVHFQEIDDGYGVFQNVPLINFSSKIAKIPTVEIVMENHKFGHGKVMEFCLQDFVGTLWRYCVRKYIE